MAIPIYADVELNGEAKINGQAVVDSKLLIDSDIIVKENQTLNVQKLQKSEFEYDVELNKFQIFLADSIIVSLSIVAAYTFAIS